LIDCPKPEFGSTWRVAKLWALQLAVIVSASSKRSVNACLCDSFFGLIPKPRPGEHAGPMAHHAEENGFSED